VSTIFLSVSDIVGWGDRKGIWPVKISHQQNSF